MKSPALLLVMPPAGTDDELAVVDSEDQAVGFVNGEVRTQLLHGDDSDARDAARLFRSAVAVRGGGSSACRSGSLRRRRECARDRRAGLRRREPQREGPVGQWSAV